MSRLTKILFLACLLGMACPATTWANVRTGIDALEDHDFRELSGKRVGLITNQTGRDAHGRSTLQALAQAPNVRLQAIFSPEHGPSGGIETENIASGFHRLSDGRSIPLYSLYGATRAPTADMLKGLDALVFDIQDIGARFYTYATTMGLSMEAASRAGIDFVVLDRPNPINGETVEGPILQDDIRHFTAYFPIPVRHGLTMGEIAGLHNETARVRARLQVLKLEGWSRAQWYDETGLAWIKPSPNIPDLDAATLYPGIGCFESTNISVGRGTPFPFRWVGAPWLDAPAMLARVNAAGLEGISFSTESFTPTKGAFAGQECRGLRLRVTNRGSLRPLRVFAVLACALRDIHPKDFSIRFDEMARMIGTRRFQTMYEQGAGPEKMIELFDGGARRFKKARARFLFY